MQSMGMTDETFGVDEVQGMPIRGPLAELLARPDRYAGRNASFYWVSINTLRSGARGYATDDELRAFAARNRLRLTVLSVALGAGAGAVTLSVADRVSPL